MKKPLLVIVARAGAVKQVEAPPLLLQGEDDTADPIGPSRQFSR